MGFDVLVGLVFTVWYLKTPFIGAWGQDRHGVLDPDLPRPGGRRANSLRRWRGSVQTGPDDFPRLPYGSIRRTPYAGPDPKPR
ncbi:hypothetical protein GCM10027278_09240 [Paralcaligenes ginsengisoli]